MSLTLYHHWWLWDLQSYLSSFVILLFWAIFSEMVIHTIVSIFFLTLTVFACHSLTLGLFIISTIISGLINGFSSLNYFACFLNCVVIFDILCERMILKFVVSISTHNLHSILLFKMINFFQLISLEFCASTYKKIA